MKKGSKEKDPEIFEKEPNPSRDTGTQERGPSSLKKKWHGFNRKIPDGPGSSL